MATGERDKRGRSPSRCSYDSRYLRRNVPGGVARCSERRPHFSAQILHGPSRLLETDAKTLQGSGFLLAAARIHPSTVNLRLHLRSTHTLHPHIPRSPVAQAQNQGDVGTMSAEKWPTLIPP